MRFLYPWVLLGLPFIFVLYALIWRHTLKPAWIRITLPKVSEKSPAFGLATFLKLMALGCMVIAASRPQQVRSVTERSVSGVDIVLALDVSASMAIEDLADESRLSVAKGIMKDFVIARRNDRIGLVMFSGEPYTLSPPTLDAGLVLHQLSQADLNLLRDGTAIGDGLALSVGHLRQSKSKSKVVILLTDGENNLGQVDPLTAGELAKGYGVRVYTIAIGTEGPVKIPIKTRNVFGQMVVSYQYEQNSLNPELLQKIAQLTQGRFYRVTDQNTLAQVFHEIDQLERSDQKIKNRVLATEMFHPWVLLSLLMVLASLSLERFWWRILT